MRQGEPGWLEWRRGGIGSSDAAPIMGVCPFRTIGDVYRDKRGEADRPPNAAMRRGTVLEPVARAEYERAADVVVQPATLTHPTVEWMRASLDGLTLDGDHFVEVKCPGEGTYARLREAGQPSDNYLAQMQHQYAVTGARTADLWVWHPDYGGMRLPVARDEAYIARLIEAEGQFWAMVLDGVPPPEPGVEQRTDSPWLDAAREYIRTEAVVAEWTGRKDAARELLIHMTGDATSVTGGGVRVTKYVRKGNVDYRSVPQLKGVDLTPYRAPSTEAARITIMED